VSAAATVVEMNLKIDHVTIAGPDLRGLESELSSLGLGAVYGGMHSNGITHMSVVGFDDGSYIELISTVSANTASPLWGDYIAEGAGICAWAVDVDDVREEAARVAALGVTVNGPAYMNRERPDGVLAEWDLAFLGDHTPGAKLPFIIKDRTPRINRVAPSESVAGSELIGIGKVVLGVKDISSSIEMFRRVYDWPEPAMADDGGLGARLADFANAPVMLASPLSGEGRLAARIERFGDLPCGLLIRTVDMERTAKRFKMTEQSDIFGRKIAWLPEDALHGTKLGFIE
jgi:hypothetical protein